MADGTANARRRSIWAGIAAHRAARGEHEFDVDSAWRIARFMHRPTFPPMGARRPYFREEKGHG